MTVSRRATFRVPNYDLPNPAPEPLRLVQQFVNTVDRENEREWLPDWLAEHGLPASAQKRATELREALRSLLHVNNAGGTAPGALRLVADAARASVVVELDEDGVSLAGTDPLGQVVAVALTAMLDESWPRLKVCRNCEWAFYDKSKNRAGSWCSMQLCGNRKKTREYRARRRRAA
jgi:predicted RNA-binding Zn ribbon-like protein